MARKNLLTGLLGDELPAGNSAEQAHPEAEKAAAPHLGVMGTRGAIGAVTRSIEQLKAHSIVDLDPELIDAFVYRRPPGEHAREPQALWSNSIREHGQQVPALGAAASAQGRPLPDRLRPPATAGRSPSLAVACAPSSSRSRISSSSSRRGRKTARARISRSSRGRSSPPGWRRAVTTAKRSWPRCRSTRQDCRG